MNFVRGREIASDVLDLEGNERFTPARLHLGAALKPYRQQFHSLWRNAGARLLTIPRVVLDGRSSMLLTSQGIVAESADHVTADLLRAAAGVSIRRRVTKISGQPRVGYNVSWRNYYHWLTQCLPAIYAYAVTSPEPEVFLPRLEALQRDSLALSGVAIREIAVDDGAQYRCGSVVISSYLGGAMDYRRSLFARPLYDRLRASVEDRGDRQREPRLIYVSRTDARRRPLLNEAEAIAMVERLGFTVVTATQLTLEQQIRTFRAAKVVMGPHGAGLANTVFCDEAAKIYEFMPASYVNPCFISLAQLRGQEYWADAFASPAVPEVHDAGWTADLDVLRTRLDQILRLA